MQSTKNGIITSVW